MFTPASTEKYASSDHDAGLFQTLVRHRYLLAQFTRREIESQTRGSVLGALWWVIQPLLMLGLYSVVFGMVMGGHFQGIEGARPYDFPLGIFLGLGVLNLITETMNMSPHAVVGQPNLVHKVRFPTELLPLSKIGASLVRLGATLVLGLLGILLLSRGWDWETLLFPVIILPVILMAVGLSWLLAALGVYVRDSQQIMGFLSAVVFYTSAVFYSAASIPDSIMQYLRFNPVLHAVEELRNLLLWDAHPVNWDQVGYLYLWGLGLCLIGHFVFKRLKNTFADVL